MNITGMMQFINRQVKQIQQGGASVLARKSKLLPLYVLAIPTVLTIRLIKPWLLVRLGGLISQRIGHFAGNTELYLCERDAGINMPNQRYIDIFYMDGQTVCNQQLTTMWKRVLRIWPAWILSPIFRINRLIPGGKSHEVGNNTQHDRDVHNLYEQFLPHLKFSDEEKMRGEVGLREMGIPMGAQFVCLIVRDSAYLGAQLPGCDLNYHNYRDSDIQNYVLAAEALAERGYFVIRMGAKVDETINSEHTKVIDYAANGMRSDFMDIYLGAYCAFCITVGTGFDAVPIIFRRPIVQVNAVPLGHYWATGASSLLITKHHIDKNSGHELTLHEIFLRGVGFCLRSSCFEHKDVDLLENTPEEIRDIVTEMVERLVDTWQSHPDDEALQKRFWEIFPTDAVDAIEGKPLHGEIRGRFGANFLRNNRNWLD
jgi:putative glycosyltransferase (TIGR04372 family)